MSIRSNDFEAKTRILIADDHPLLREALCQVLSKEQDMEVVGKAGDGEEVVTMASQLKPDLVIMDIIMPKFDGIEASKKIKQLPPT